MRLYSFCNMYLSSIQQGIQTAHLVSNMFAKYANMRGKPEHHMLFKWANDHKTIIVLNGGTKENIQNIFNELWLNADLNLPYDKFHEDEDSLGGIVTCCGIIVPEEMYETIQTEEGDYYNEQFGSIFKTYLKDTPEWNIIDVIKSRHLAR